MQQIMTTASLNIIISTTNIRVILIYAKDNKDIRHENLKQLKFQWVGTQTKGTVKEFLLCG